MKSVTKVTLLCVYFVIVSSLPVKNHPPVWEYTYQYELFEKIYRQIQFLLTEIGKISAKLTERSCPPNWTSGNSKCYYLALHRKLDWFQSEEACERLGSRLAIIQNEQESTSFVDYFNKLQEIEELSPGNVWIGGFKYNNDDSWRWVTGENVSYVNWDPDLEMSDTVGRPCMVMTGQYWNARRCSKDLHYVCEREPVFL
jgi:hypothetical protein